MEAGVLSRILSRELRAPRPGAPVTHPLPPGHRERRALAEPRALLPELRRPHGPPRILLGFPWSACVRITWEVFETYRSRGAPPRTCDREPAGGAPERAFQSLCPGGLRRAPASGQRERGFRRLCGGRLVLGVHPN